MSLRFAFIMDPIDRIQIGGDSTFVLMLEAQRRGHRVLYSEQTALELRGSKPWARVREVHLERKPGAHFRYTSELESLCLDDVDAVFMRKDPPFDVHYLVSTYILDRVDRTRVVMINDPSGLRDCNEKLFATLWPDLMPTTLVTSDRAQIRSMMEQMGTVIVKPLLAAGGAGVLQLHKDDPNVGSILDLLTHEGRVLVMVQEFLPRITEGDKRIILLNGDAIGAVNRRPAKHDIRANMHVGGTAEPAVIDDQDQKIVKRLAPELKKRGLVFVGIDVIDGRLTEINVTSPTGLQEIDRFDGASLEGKFVDWIEEKRSALSP